MDKSDISRGRRGAFFMCELEAAVWLCSVKWSVPGEGTRNHERNWNPGL
jgi:hypothetical protein